MSRSPSFYPGMPAVFCQRRAGAVDLEPLADVLQADEPVLVWLDSARTHPLTGRYSILAWDPWVSLVADGDTLLVTTAGTGSRRLAEEPLPVISRLLRSCPGPRGEGLPPAGIGLFTVFGYEVGNWIERLPAPKPGALALPRMLCYGMRRLIVVDHQAAVTWCVSTVDPYETLEHAEYGLWRIEQLVDAWAAASLPAVGASMPVRVEPVLRPEAFEAMVRSAQEHIAAGDIFQANLSQEFVGEWTGSAWPLYRRLRRVNPSPFACFVKTPHATLVSCSPERLVQMRDGVAQTRPIAGTRPRGMAAKDDLIRSLELMLSEKERAEHIMLVDLERNDLGRVCKAGSVAVDELMAVEEYSHVIHLVSNVRGGLRDGADAVDVLRAMFPGGTITGCPKIRSMEIIHALEPSARGLYTGSCGYLGFDGAADLNILIRTLVLAHGRLSFHVGAGIVADSKPALEYQETLAKAGALLKALRATMVGNVTRC